MADDAAFIWDEPTPSPPKRRPNAVPQEAADDRITLREAEHRFGIRVSTLRAWSRRGSVDAELMPGPHGDQWMVTPESVAHHLSRRSPKTEPAARRKTTGPTGDGSSMLVPRDAWDKLMDQLGNLHEAGLQLADARERAAKAETEATFLRERLGEMRAARDELKERTTSPSREQGTLAPRPSGWWIRLLSRRRR